MCCMRINARFKRKLRARCTCKGINGAIRDFMNGKFKLEPKKKGKK